MSITDSVPRAMLALNLEVTDSEVIAELSKYDEGPARAQFALGALHLGVLAIRNASGALDQGAIERAGEKLIGDVRELLASRAQDIAGQVQSTVKQYFDPATGLVTERMKNLVQPGGDLDRILQSNLGQGNVALAKTLAENVGENSGIFKLLSPTDRTGVIARMEKVLADALDQQKNDIVGQFSLDNQESALSRLVREVNGLQDGLKKEFDERIQTVSKEFSLDKKDSALSRLLDRTLETYNEMARTNNSFHQEVRESLLELKVRRQEEMRSTRHGGTFENELLSAIDAEAQRFVDICQATGSSTGTISHCKVGDAVVTLGVESPAPGEKIVWEAKEDQSYDLAKALAECDTARKNRGAQICIFAFSKATAPDSLPPFTRHGRDIVIVWDAQDPASDIYVKVAYSVARALAIRAKETSGEEAKALGIIEESIRDIERQVNFLDELATSANTAKNAATKIIERVALMRQVMDNNVKDIDAAIAAIKIQNE
jgi:hypothetical protein